ncbi:MAG: hypothetical protein U9P80_02060 [Thermodesulfobacteriota bacterium]|nr:hypothetical protein [Thermodesulfobacteriota bacterium]
MQKVSLDKLKPGMVLAKPVINEKGMALCAEGTELSATLIQRLARMNVSMVTLKGHPVEMGAPVKTRDERVAELEQRFEHVMDNPIMEKIQSAITKAIMAEDEEEEEEEMPDEQG